MLQIFYKSLLVATSLTQKTWGGGGKGEQTPPPLELPFPEKILGTPCLKKKLQNNFLFNYGII